MTNTCPEFKAAFRNTNPRMVEALSKHQVVLLISPGYDYHESNKLSAIINLINKSNFSNCLVVIGDTNYRHTLKISHPQCKNLYEKAKEIGDHWLERNIKFLDLIKIENTISRWQEWLDHPDYILQREKLDRHYENNAIFREAFESSAEEFVNRFIKHKSAHIPLDEAIQASIEYLKEECTIIMPMWAKQSINTIIYPNKMLYAMNAVYQELVIPDYGDSLHWLTLRFKRYTYPEMIG